MNKNEPYEFKKVHKGIFITGTDTGVGKTFVTSGLITAFKEMGLSVCPMKPVETGCSMKNGSLIPKDTLRLIKVSKNEEPLDVINPYRFKLPLAPAVAAKLEGVVIKKQKILSAYKKLSRKYDMTIVEGSGGLMVPVYKQYLFVDLVKELSIPLIIVSRPGLGTINHTLLTTEAAQNRGIYIPGIIINYTINKRRKSLAEKTNPEIIKKLGGVRILGIVPYSKVSTPYLRKIFLKIADEILHLS